MTGLPKCVCCGKEIPDHEPVYYGVVNGELYGICEQCEEQECEEDDDQ